MSTSQCTEARFLCTDTFSLLRRAAHATARNRRCYLSAARFFEDEGLQVLAHAFRFTAAQEKEQAAVCRGLLSAYGHMTLPATEAPSAPPVGDALALLRAAADAEEQNAHTLFPALIRAAEQEDFPRIAHAIRRMGETEQAHAQRFRRYAQRLQEDTLFRDENRVGWLCLRCGARRCGQEPPRQCADCLSGHGAFIRSDFTPFALG